MMTSATGRIVKATGGFYYVETGDRVVECRARGIFRKNRQSPLVGDMVDIAITSQGEGSVDFIQPRKNSLVRPPLANLDYMVAVVSTVDPAPNYLTLDKFLATLAFHDIPAMLAITKTDLAPAERLSATYSLAGYPVCEVNSQTGQGMKELTQLLSGSFCAFAGNSGVGKSTLLNALDPSLGLEVGDTSKKLGRGRHTTRHVEMHALAQGFEVADTPGFSSLDLVQLGDITPDTLADCFPDFALFAPHCKFRDCRHLAEEGCVVKEAAENGEIAPSRYQSYLQIYEEIKDVKAWEQKRESNSTK